MSQPEDPDTEKGPAVNPPQDKNPERYSNQAIEEGRRIIDKQFEAHYKIQDRLFRLIRLSITAITAIIGIVSLITSDSIKKNIPSYTQTAFDSVDSLSRFSTSILPKFYLDEWVFLVLVVFTDLVSLLISLVFASVGVSIASRGITRVFANLSAPRLAPLNKKGGVEISGSEKSPLKDWIKENNRTIRKEANGFDNIYSDALKSILLFSASFTFGISAWLSLVRIELLLIGLLLYMYLIAQWNGYIQGLFYVQDELDKIRDKDPISDGKSVFLTFCFFCI